MATLSGLRFLQASDRVYYVYQTLADAEAIIKDSPAADSDLDRGCSNQGSDSIVAAVEAALCDDLNTPQAVALLSEPLKALNDLMHTKKVICLNQSSALSVHHLWNLVVWIHLLVRLHWHHSCDAGQEGQRALGEHPEHTRRHQVLAEPIGTGCQGSN